MTPSASCHIPWWIEANTPNEAADRAEARTLSLTPVDVRPSSDFYIARASNGRVTLFRTTDSGRDDSLSVDLAADGHRDASRKTSLLARACGLHRRSRLRVLDTTAGLGHDSAVLAGFGCPITAIERHPVPAALSRDALTRARNEGMFDDLWSCILFDDAREFLNRTTDEPPDVVLMDPMFLSPRRKARPNKSMEWLHEIIGSDERTDALLSGARTVASQRVVVKRHARQPSLVAPDLTFGTRAIRFDVYLEPTQKLASQRLG